MKKYLFYLGIVVLFIGCMDDIDLNPKEINWDRAQCARCNMMLSDKDFAAQVVALEDGEAYNFDDIGCAIKWLNNTGNSLKLDNTILYVKNAENDKFIKAKEAKYTTARTSPMSFNFLAHTKDAKLKDYLTFSQIVLMSNKKHTH